jgi:cysteine desulfurase/selenocysteine lyase
MKDERGTMIDEPSASRASFIVHRSSFDVEGIRRDFPILRRTVRGRPLVYLDNAATTQKPQVVIDRIVRYYTEENSNVHRGVHYLSEVATAAYESARTTVKRFLNARDEKEIVFTRGATEGINLVAASWGRTNVYSGDEVLISAIEHHSNIVPWQLLCDEVGARLHIIPVNDAGELVMEEYANLLTKRTRIVAFGHASNALGTINPVREMTAMAHAAGAIVLIDGAQGAPHINIDVQDIGCDFYAFSSHKVYGPTGIGALYGRQDLLEAMPPYQGGGDMILSVSFEKTTYNALPYKFEAGTPHIEGAIGLASALDYVAAVGIENIAAHEQELLAYATARLGEIKGLRIIGTAREKASVISFTLEGVHPHDIGTILDQEGIAIRTGHHCAQPLMMRFNVPATGRASFGMYNTKAEADALVEGLHKVIEVFG